MGFGDGLRLFMLFLVGAFMILLILVQRGKGGGLAGAFGGMGGQSAFGTKAGDLFTRITIGAACVWILLCVWTVRSFSLHEGLLDKNALGKNVEPNIEAPTKKIEDQTKAVDVGPSKEDAAKTKEDATKPDATKPDATKPDAAKPDAAKPDAEKPAAEKPAAEKPEPKAETKPEVKPEAKPAAEAKPEVKPEAKPEAKPDAPK